MILQSCCRNLRPFATYLNFLFLLCAIKTQSCQIHLLKLLRLLSLSLLCGGSNIRTQYLQGLGSVFSKIKGIFFFSPPSSPLHSPEVWIDFHWLWHSSAWTPTQSWSRQFSGGQHFFLCVCVVTTWWNANRTSTMFSSPPTVVDIGIMVLSDPWKLYMLL